MLAASQQACSCSNCIFCWSLYRWLSQSHWQLLLKQKCQKFSAVYITAVCSILVKWIFIIDRDMLLWWINRTVSWVLCLILIILILWCHSHHKRQRWKNVTLSLLSNRCFFLFYLVVQRTMRPKIKAKLFSGTWTCLCFALVDWEKPNKVNKGIIEAFEWYNQDNPKLYISLYRFVWRIFL